MSYIDSEDLEFKYDDDYIEISLSNNQENRNIELSEYIWFAIKDTTLLMDNSSDKDTSNNYLIIENPYYIHKGKE